MEGGLREGGSREEVFKGRGDPGNKKMKGKGDQG